MLKRYFLLSLLGYFLIYISDAINHHSPIPIVLYIIIPVLIALFCKPNKFYKYLVCIVINYVLMYITATMILNPEDYEGKAIFFSIRICITFVVTLIFAIKNDQEISNWLDDIKNRIVKKR